MSNNLIEKGSEIVNRAIEYDKANKLEDAFSAYSDALTYFGTAVKYEKNPKVKEMLNNKIIEYLTRAETIKKQLDARNEPTGSTGGAGQMPRSAKNKDEGPDAENAKLREALGGVIVTDKPNVSWDDVAGLEGAKDALKEAVIIPTKFPQFFTGKRRPWTGILLYGPPGTGKSYLAKALATEADATFYSVSSSDLVSKWMGESEKLVANLFAMARASAPSIIFVDEVDSLCSVRGDSESEAARRIKNEFMVQMQGIGNAHTGQVLVLGASTLPYNLDQAIRRRFEKRILIPLPDARARARMFPIHLGDTPHHLTEEDFIELGEMTHQFSGSDISVVVKDVLMEPIRMLRNATHFKQIVSRDGVPGLVPCSPGDPDPTKFACNLDGLLKAGRNAEVLAPYITMSMFLNVLEKVKPTVSADDLKVFDKFTAEFGEHGE
jgi:vacuolar protein-sorting-associated protein 4